MNVQIILVILLRFSPTSTGWLVPNTSCRLARHPALFSTPIDGTARDNEILQAVSSSIQEKNQLLGVRSIGVDYGLMRTGVATTVGYTPTPRAILSNLTNEVLCEEIVRIAAAEAASRIVVGLPLHKNGTIAEQTNLTIAFAEKLAYKSLERLGPHVIVELWDERYTSKEAAARLRSVDPRSSTRGVLDADAAAIILEHYYSENGEGARSVELGDDDREEALSVWHRCRAEENVQAQALLDEREARLAQRQSAIDRDRLLATNNESTAASKKKKKKKRR